MKDTERPPLVLVVWEDAGSLDDSVWVMNKGEREYKPILHHQVGFLLKDIPAGVIITSSWNEEIIANPEQIPRGMIRSIHTLSVGAKKRGK